MFTKFSQFIADTKMRRLNTKAGLRSLESQRQNTMIYQASRGKGFGA